MAEKALDNLDVWREILGYLEVSLDIDDPAVVREKRKAALAVALLSPNLTQLGLDTLWKAMTTLVPIAHVTNTWNDGAVHYLEYDQHTSSSLGSWYLNQPIVDQAHRLYVATYLQRIRTLHIHVSQMEQELWHVIFVMLHPISVVPLPNIRHLVLHIKGSGILLLGSAVTHLLSSTLTSITLVGPSSRNSTTAQNYIRSHHLPELTEMVYRDGNLGAIPDGIQQFRKLRCLRIVDESNFIEFGHDLLGTLNSLAGLEELQIYLGRRNGFTFTDLKGDLRLPNLCIFRLTVSTPLVLTPLLLGAHLPHLHTLSVVAIDDPGDMLNPKHIFSHVSGLSSLEHLYFQIQVRSRPTSRVLAREDKESSWNPLLAPLKKLRTVQFIDVPHKLTQGVLGTILHSLPRLQELSMDYPNLPCALIPSSTLIPLARAPEIHRITLPIDFAFLTNPLPPHTTPSFSHLTELKCCQSRGIPAQGAKKIIVLRNLLFLFPNIKWIVSDHDEDGRIAELHELLISFRQLLTDHSTW
ncbi:hypothetical protein P691DRAFT_805321 [Macrolepiota fuliginosa MF-IS2]|uniref:Uncharacterized protein n=1 Tax=Macrolepiota fuliginosa MF-IS2 TaxID=1400762 RepID=A0A9P6BZQ3_9AGAR|nr:hypothetical protein P691DRAFT_805321 [Macrolepiota fuliginosa MF-IS2]